MRLGAPIVLAIVLLAPLTLATPPTKIEEVDRLREEHGILPIEGGGVAFVTSVFEPGGDLDANGADEALAVSHAWAQEGGIVTARIDAISGDGSLLWSRSYGENVYVTTFSLGDVTGDGHADVGVQASTSTITLLGGFTCLGAVVTWTCAMWHARVETLYVELVDGATGEARWAYELPATTDVLTTFTEFGDMIAGAFANNVAWRALHAVPGPEPAIAWVADSYAGPGDAGVRSARIVVLDASTGVPRWTWDAPSVAGGQPFVLVVPDASGDATSEILVESGHLGDARVTMHDGATGAPLWAALDARAHTWDVLPGAPVTLLAARGATLSVLDAATGATLGEASREKWLAPTILPDGLVLVREPTSEGALLLRALRAPALDEAWSVTLSVDAASEPQWFATFSRGESAPLDRLVLAAAAWRGWNGETTFFSIDPSTGEVVGQHAVLDLAQAAIAAGDADGQGAGDAVALVAGMSYQVALVRGEDGAPAWTRDLRWGQQVLPLGGDRLLAFPAWWDDPAFPLDLEVVDAATGATATTVSLPPLA